MVESGDDYMQRQLSLKRTTETTGSFSFKIEWFLMLASASITGENSVTTRPCPQHGLTSEYTVYLAPIRTKISDKVPLSLSIISYLFILLYLFNGSKLAAAKRPKYLDSCG